MRCKNCGWPNKPGATVCCKCKSPLENDETQLGDNVGEELNDSPASSSLGSATVQQSDVDPEAKTIMNIPAPDDGGHMPTVAEGLPNSGLPSSYEQESSPATRPEIRFPDECPQCHYPLRPNTRRCPNCQAVIWPIDDPNNDSILPPVRQSTMYGAPVDSSASSTVMVSPHDEAKPKPAESEFCGTVNPYMKPKPRAEFSLELIPGQGEVLREREHNYEGAEVVLNRSNTESTNNTITSKVQAVVKFDGERWTIEDHSSLQTTYVRAGRPIELREGDIILLGDRQFIFHVD